jgi:glycosyltransferase involved in cell wall biosynthesis
MKKIGIYYDSLVSKGGAERVVIELANMLGADIITSGYDSKINVWTPIDNQVINVGNVSIKFLKPLGTLFEAPVRYYFARKKFKYDVNIFIGFTSIFASNKQNENIWYCLTPNRIIYDLRNLKLNDPIFVRKILFMLHIKLFNRLDQKIIKTNFSKIISQSSNVQKRVRKYYGLDSSVIYPPTDTNKFKFEQFGDFYLTVSRLFPEKRTNLIAKAFIKIPEKKLVIVGDGPQKNKIKNLIKGHSNITLFNNISDNKLYELYANCLATIFMARDEDYGLIPIEGMAAGKPCIAVDEGGCKETVVNGKTGFLIKATEDNIINAVKKLDINKAKEMKDDCLIWVKNFETEICFKQWKKELRSSIIT